MPIFEFQCTGCGREFDELVSSTAQRPQVACPGCGSSAVERKLSVFAARSSAGGGAAMRSRGEAGAGPGGCGRCGDPAGPCGMN